MLDKKVVIVGVSILYCWIKVSIVVCDFDIDICKRNIHGTENLQTEQESGATRLTSEPPTKEKSQVPPDSCSAAPIWRSIGVEKASQESPHFSFEHFPISFTNSHSSSKSNELNQF